MDLVYKTIKEELSLARDPNTPKDVLRELSKNSNWLVRRHVGSNPSISLDILRKLAKDVNFVVRRYVAKNPKASGKILVMLFEYEKSLREPDDDVIRALYAHKNLPHIAKVIIETLFGDWVL